MSTIKTYWREVLIILLLVWALYGNFKNPAVKPQIELKEVIAEEVIEVDIKEETKEIDFNSLTYNEAFNKMYSEYGDGHVFEWRDGIYLTKLKIGE